MTNLQRKPLELYIHVPFCARKCLYCDFLSFRALASVHEAYTEQLIREIEVQGACCREYQVHRRRHSFCYGTISYQGYHAGFKPEF